MNILQGTIGLTLILGAQSVSLKAAPQALLAMAKPSQSRLETWPKSYYLDTSPSYFRLKKDGFRIRFRMSDADCQDLASAVIQLRNGLKVPMTLVTQDATSWPKPYGLDDRALCWWQGQVDNQSLDNDSALAWVIRLVHQTDGHEIVDQHSYQTLIPAQRLQPEPILSWHSLAPFGATPVEGGGVYFRIWEPVAQAVDLYWSESPLMPPRILNMKTTSALGDPHRSFQLYIRGAKALDAYHYRFVKAGAYENLLIANHGVYSPRKIDPYAQAISYAAKGGYHNGYIDVQGLVAAGSSYDWLHDRVIADEIKSRPDQWLIYQLWPLTFNPQLTEDGIYSQGTFANISQKIPYLKALGINTVEFLPLNEGRFRASWGYALDSLFLIEQVLGSPADLKKLIDQLHGAGIRVVFDVVINHINNHLLREPLTAAVHRSKFFDGDTGWGPKPDFSRYEVRRWVSDALLYLIQEFHIDGFRFDMIEFVYRDSPTGYRFIQELLALIKLNHPHFYIAAEQLPDHLVATKSVDQGGLGFDSQWNNKFKNFFELHFDRYRSDSRDLDLPVLQAALRGFSDELGPGGGEKLFPRALETDNYLGSHDFIGNKNPLIRIVSDYFSEETSGQNRFFRVRPLWGDQGIDDIGFRQIHNEFNHALVRASYGVLFTKPGHILFYQGEELGQDLNIENEWSYLAATDQNTLPSQDIDLNRYIGSHRLPWEYAHPELADSLSFLNPEEQALLRGHLRFFKDFLGWRRAHPSIDYDHPQEVTLIFDGQGLAYQLKSYQGTYLVMVNFGEDRDGDQVYLPGNPTSFWQEVLPSNRTKYGASHEEHLNIMGLKAGRDQTIRLGGPGLTIFEQVQTARLAKEVFLRGTFNDWQALKQNQLAEIRPGVYGATIDVNHSQSHQFKLATADWQTAWGQQLPRPKGPVTAISYHRYSPNVTFYLKKGRYDFRFFSDSQTFQFIATSAKDPL